MKAVKTLRLLLNIPQAQLAESAGISARELSRIEKGQVYPSRETMTRLDAAFDQEMKNRWINEPT
jgi:transcriptional regulator with XRE-family HTH domain